ncbi:MAG: cytoplasmic protein [Kiritimatiellae bacterium]|nr:cytoplasmic protein [Kiritimatiellia bacterium]
MGRMFDRLRASELYCPRCRTAQPVRERLLLIIPRGELHEYRCTVCGESLATREVKMAPKPLELPPR